MHGWTSSIPTSAFPLSLMGFVILCTAIVLDVAGARAGDLIVRYDQAQLLKLPRPIGEVIVGNASIADVTVQGGNLLVITGKTFGVTNVIALDSERNIIQDQRIVVERDQALINVHRGTQRQTYNCSPQCQPNLTIGDSAEYFDLIRKQNTEKTKFSETTGENDKGGQ